MNFSASRRSKVALKYGKCESEIGYNEFAEPVAGWSTPRSASFGPQTVILTLRSSQIDTQIRGEIRPANSRRKPLPAIGFATVTALRISRSFPLRLPKYLNGLRFAANNKQSEWR